MKFSGLPGNECAGKQYCRHQDEQHQIQQSAYANTRTAGSAHRSKLSNKPLPLQDHVEQHKWTEREAKPLMPFKAGQFNGFERANQ